MALIIPVVMADSINQKMDVTLKMAQLATDMTGTVPEITECGSEISFPRFDRIAEIGEITKGTAVVPQEISMTDNKAPIRHTGGAIRCYRKDQIQIKGQVLENMAQQLADGMSRDLDDALSEVMLAKAVKKSPQANATSITADEIFTALSLFGDDVDTDSYAGIAVNSRLLPSLLQMPEFTSIEKTYQTDGNGIIKNGLVGMFMGIKIFVTNNGTWDTSKNETVSFVVKRDALGYVKQKDVSIEIEHEAKLFADDIVADSLYAVNVMDADGIVILRKTVA